jgi:hypothetical protein
MSLRSLLIPYDVRKTVLGSLSAYDVAKLDMVMGNFLDASERNRYLNPTRDFIWDTKEMENLIDCGMKLLLLGNNTSALTRRLQDPEGYLRSYGHGRKLQIYLIGYFPIAGVTSDILDRMLKFTITGAPSKCRTFRDKIDLRNMKVRIWNNSLSTNAAYIMSFGISTQIGTNNRACWHKIDDIPDCTIDLRVYIPELYNRLWEEVQIPCRESLRLSRCILRRGWYFSSLIDFLRIYRKNHALDLAHLMPRYIQAIENNRERGIKIRSLRTRRWKFF